MHTIVATKSQARQIKSVIDRIGGVDCDIISDCGAYRVSESSISGSVFGRVRELIEAGVKGSTIVAADVI